MSTAVCELLGIGQPIVQAPMAAVPRLAAAVSNAGALGMVTLTWSADAGAVVRETAALTARPFGANLYEIGWPDAPHRALRNSTARAWEAAGRLPPGQRPGEGEVIAHFASGEPIVRYEPAPPMTGTTGDIEALSMWAGQGVALAGQPQPAADIVAELTSRL
jgi:NAD(P)H-dependent flavin oxidoreductase YrpB (nitropropane dioxygenase family)